MQQNGKIGVNTENLFPIIKKFLYSDQDIFLRELVSNAVDATQKLKALGRLGEYAGDTTNATIRVTINAEEKTLTISDEGIGMTAEEVEKYINQIAFSGAEEFVAKYKDKVDNIIGHFGLGFYSSFMVSKKVEIVTLSHKPGSQAVRWECDGSSNYTIDEASRDRVGTDIILHIDDEQKEYLEKQRIDDMLKKHCKFLPVPIAFGKKQEWKDGKYVDTDAENIINNTHPAWTRKPADLTNEDYAAFYSELYPMAEEPLFNIHLNVDYPFNLTGILYFPKIRSNFEMHRNKIQLYCNQVFVTDSVEGIVPDFLTMLHGVLDSPDIPLNVSRSYLQSDGNVKKISSHITKKVADRLYEIFNNTRADFEKKWDDLKLFITYGMLTDEKFYEKAEKFSLLKNTDGKYFTFEEYRALTKDNQTDKDGTLIFLYATNTDEQYSYIDKARAKGYDVAILDGHLDAHFINHLEQKLEKVRFTRVDADVVDKLIAKDNVAGTSLSIEQQNEMRPVVQSLLRGTEHFDISFEDLGANEMPMVITRSEFMRRMKDMSKVSGNSGMNFYGTLPDSYNLVINATHPVMQAVMAEKDAALSAQLQTIASKAAPLQANLTGLEQATADKKPEEIATTEKDAMDALRKQIADIDAEKQQALTAYGSNNAKVKQMIDLALIANNMLKGEDLAKFVARSITMIK